MSTFNLQDATCKGDQGSSDLTLHMMEQFKHMQIVEQQQEEQVMENMYEPGYTQHDLHKAQMSQHAGTAPTSISIFQPLESVYIYKSSTRYQYRQRY